MPRSERTLELNADAHQKGDEYYRCLATISRSETGVDPECINLANAYIQALETLRSHLSTLQYDPDVAVLMHTTDGHIRLVHGDLKHFPTSGDIS